MLFWVGSWFILQGQVSLGLLISFNAPLGYFLGPLKNLFNLQPSLQQAFVAADRLGEILDLDQEIPAEGRWLKPDRFDGRLDRQGLNAEVRAPLGGTVEELKKVNPGDFLLVGEEVARLVPEGSDRLNLELTVDNRDIAKVAPEMAVLVRFTALPPSEYGQLEVRVSTVPADATALDNQPAVFVVGARVDQPWLENKAGHRIVLKPGMGAEARIVIKRKNILRFLLEKLDFLS